MLSIAWLRSSMMSCMSSIPIENLTKPSLNPFAFLISSGIFFPLHPEGTTKNPLFEGWQKQAIQQLFGVMVD